MEYLGFWVTLTGIRPINKKLEAIVNMKPPKNTKEVREFICIVNYYRDMWSKRSHLINPLNFTLCDVSAVKGFNRCFDTHIDASDYPLGAVIIQNGKNNLFRQPKTDRTTNTVYSNGKGIAEYCQNLKVISHAFIGSKVKNVYWT